MSGTVLQSSDTHGFMVSRTYSWQPQKPWQGSTTTPKLQIKQAIYTVSSAYCLTQYPNINESDAANISAEMLEGKKEDICIIWQSALARSAAQWEQQQYSCSACPEALQGRALHKKVGYWTALMPPLLNKIASVLVMDNVKKNIQTVWANVVYP